MALIFCEALIRHQALTDITVRTKCITGCLVLPTQNFILLCSYLDAIAATVRFHNKYGQTRFLMFDGDVQFC